MSAQVTTGLTSKSSEFLVEDALASSHVKAPISDPEAAWAAYTCYEETGAVAHLDNAINLFQQANDALASEPHAKLIGWLGYCLSKRFDALGKLNDLEHATIAQQCALKLVPDEHPSRALRLNGLAYSLRQRFQRLGKLDNLESAIMLQHRAIEVTPDGHPDMAVLSGFLGSLQRLRYERLGDLDNLEAAIKRQRRAVELTSDEHSNMPRQLHHLAISLRTRFQHLGELDDLESAIRMQRRSVELGPDGHPDMPMWLEHLAWLQHLRYERFGDLDDLEHAIAGRRRAVELTPDGHRDMPSWLNNLGHSLRTRFERLGELHDLESAITMQHRAVVLTPDDHPNTPIWLDNLALTKQLRYRRLGEFDDLESAIRMQHRAVELTPDEHPDMALWLDNLGSLQHLRHEHLGDLEDLEHAIAGRRRAVELTPEGHSDMPVRLNNLGYTLSSRFQCIGDIVDLECAITAQSRAIELTPHTHSHKPLWLFNLGLSLAEHFQVERTQKGFDEAMSCLMAALDQPPVSPSWRLHAAQFAIKLLNEYSEFGAPETLLLVYTRIFDMLPEIIWLGHSLSRRLEESQRLRGMSNSAIHVAIESGALAQAVEWLDAWRSFIWSQVLSLRNPVDELAEDHPDLAGSFKHISAQLQGTVSASLLPPESVSVTIGFPALIANAKADRHRGLAIEWGRILANIRRQSGFGDFMKPRKFAALSPTSTPLSGTVVFINVDHASCDALVLSPEGTISTVILPELSSDKAEAIRLQWLAYLEQHNVRQRGSHTRRGSRSPSVRHVLGCIWRWIVYPILQALGANDPKSTYDQLPHVTWCPTGPLTQLPLHAAGIYDEGSGPRIYNCVVSSYTPSLSALTRSIDAVVKQRHVNPSVLVVTQPDTPGMPPLPGTTVEGERLRQVLSQAQIAHSAFNGKQALTTAVRAALDDHPWLHLACHGSQDITDPMKSAFALYDGPLSLTDLMATTANNAELAFLSACQTAVGDEKIPEESMHLAAGMLAVGYKGVIATMWSIRDDDAPLVVEAYYKKLLGLRASGTLGKGETGAAYALHDATKRLREEVGEKEFARWAPFVHFGV